MNKSNSKPKYLVTTIIKASNLIEALGKSNQEMGIKELSKLVGSTASTTHRILNTLASIGYIQRNPSTHQYKLGIGLFQIGARVLSQYGMNPDVRTILEELMETTGETAKLGALFNGKLVYLGLVESSHPLRFTGHIGSWAPLHCTAMGKVLLSTLSRSEQEAIITSLLPLKQFTPNTITNKDKLFNLLDAVHQLGYAIDDEEYLVGSRGIASPVMNVQGQTPTSVSISGPSARLSQQILLSFLPSLRRAAKELLKVVTL